MKSILRLGIDSHQRNAPGSAASWVVGSSLRLPLCVTQYAALVSSTTSQKVHGKLN